MDMSTLRMVQHVFGKVSVGLSNTDVREELPLWVLKIYETCQVRKFDQLSCITETDHYRNTTSNLVSVVTHGQITDSPKILLKVLIRAGCDCVELDVF